MGKLGSDSSRGAKLRQSRSRGAEPPNPPHFNHWELVYADDLAVIAETEEELIKRLNEWKDNVESKGMRVSINKTKVMVSGER